MSKNSSTSLPKQPNPPVWDERFGPDPEILFRFNSEEDGGDDLPYECSDPRCHCPMDCNGEHSYSLDVWRSRYGRYLYTREEYEYFGWSFGDGGGKTLSGEEVTSKLGEKKIDVEVNSSTVTEKKSPDVEKKFPLDDKKSPVSGYVRNSSNTVSPSSPVPNHIVGYVSNSSNTNSPSDDGNVGGYVSDSCESHS